MTSNYTPVPHDWLEALYRASLKAAEIKTALFLARQTWGWVKKSGGRRDRLHDKWSSRKRGGLYKQMAREMRISKTHAHRALKTLVGLGIAVPYVRNGRVATYGLQRDPTIWTIQKTRNRRPPQNPVPYVGNRNRPFPSPMYGTDRVSPSPTLGTGTNCLKEIMSKKKEEKEIEPPPLLASRIFKKDFRNTPSRTDAEQRALLSAQRDALAAGLESTLLKGKTADEIRELIVVRKGITTTDGLNVFPGAKKVGQG